MLNLSNRPLTLTINGTDYTALVETISAQTVGESEAGLFTTTGNILLANNPVGFAGVFELDDLINNDFRPGNLITCTYVDSGAAIPKVGYALIERSEYQEESLATSLFFTDLLGYLNSKRPADVAVCFERGSGLTVGQTIIDLLLAAGISLANINDADILAQLGDAAIRQNIYLTKEESIIRVAGSLAYNNGYGLWQNEEGVIQIIALAEPGGVLLGSKQKQNLQSFTRAANTELIPDRLEITGVRLIDAQPIPGASTYDFGNGVVASTSDLANFQYYTEAGGAQQYADRVNRVIAAQKWTNGILHDLLPDVFSNSQFRNRKVREVFTRETYEDPPIEPNECVPIDEGRILTRRETTKEPVCLGLRNYFANRLVVLQEEARQEGIENGDTQEEIDAAVAAITIDNVTAPLFLTIRSDSILPSTTKETREEWEYNLPYKLEQQTEVSLSLSAETLNTGSAESFNSAYSVTYRRTVREATGVWFPPSADLSLGLDTDAFILLNPLQLDVTEVEERTWTLSPDFQTWTQQTSFRQVAYRAEPERFLSGLEDANIGVQQLYNYAAELTDIPLNEPPRTPPPSFARFPAETQPLELPFKTTVNINPAAQYPVTKTVNYESFTESRAVAEEQGFALAKRVSYRSKNHKLTTDLCSLDSARPFGRYDVYDARAGLTKEFVIDGSSLTIDANGGSVFAFNAMLLGFTAFDPAAPVLTQAVAPNAASDPAYCYRVDVDPSGTQVVATSFECGRYEFTLSGDPYTVSAGQAFTPDDTLIPGAVIDVDDSFFFNAYLPGGTGTPLQSPDTALGLNAICNTIFTCSATSSNVVQSPMEVECNTTFEFSISQDVLGYIVLAEAVDPGMDEYIIVE